MQEEIECCPDTLQAIEKALTTARIRRYMCEAGEDELHALRLYIWNSRLCEAFYLPIQFAEIVIRNAVHSALIFKFGLKWYENRSLLDVLSSNLRRELERVIAEERQQHGDIDGNNITSSLSFGFWEDLMDKRFHHILWKGGTKHQFPNRPMNYRISQIRERVEKIRAWRNRIAHYSAIFDREPTRMHAEILETISWTCDYTAAFTRKISRVSKVVASKPRLSNNDVVASQQSVSQLADSNSTECSVTKMKVQFSRDYLEIPESCSSLAEASGQDGATSVEQDNRTGVSARLP
jgi:hypothetical protein